MNRIAISVAAAGAFAAAGLGLAPSAIAAPSGPPSVTQAVSNLQAHGYTVIVNSVGTAPLDQCTMYSVRHGQTYTRMDTGFPGAGTDIVTQVVSMTVYLDTNC